MKKLLVILFANLFCLCSIAQINTNKYEERGKQKVENRVDQKVDQAMDKALNKIEGLFKKKNKTTTSPRVESEPEVSSEREDVDELSEEEKEAAAKIMESVYGEPDDSDYGISENEFVGRFTIEFSHYKNEKLDKSSPVMIDYNMSKSKTSMKMRSKDERIGNFIIDLSENTIIIVTEDKGRKQGVKMKRPKAKVIENVLDDFTAQRTGEFKTIDGYKCEKVIYTDTKRDAVTTAWVTQDVNLDWKNLAESMSSGRMKVKGPSMTWIQGFPIESETIENGGKERHTMKASNIKPGMNDSEAFDTSGVEIISVPSFGN